jgi:hypothetical protein
LRLKILERRAEITLCVDHLVLYLPFAIVVAAALLVGVIFRWWGLLVPAGAASFLAYAWEFTPEGVSFAVIAGFLGCAGVAAGALGRRAFRKARG